MKAAVFKEVGTPLVVENVADPQPDPGGLVMKVAYCGVCGTDLHATREGLTTACCGQIIGRIRSSGMMGRYWGMSTWVRLRKWARRQRATGR